MIKDKSIFLTIILLAVILSSQKSGVASWPEFRGGQSLPGTTKTAIPQNIKLKWSFQTGDEIKSSPVISGGQIVFGGTDGFVYCISLDGKLIWKFEAGNAVEAPPLIHANKVFIGDLSGNMYALKLDSGNLLWTYEADNQINAAPNWWSDGKNTYLLFGSYDYYLHCVDASNGNVIWKYEAQNYLHATVAVEGNYAIFGGCDGLLHVVDIRTGQASSTIEIATYVAGSAALGNGLAFIGDYDGQFTCIDYKNQTVRWQFESRDRQLPFIASPVISGDMVITGSRDRFVYCLDKNSGTLIWQRNTGNRIDASPLADRNNVLIVNMRGDLMLLNQLNGNTVWTYELGIPVAASPAIAEGMIIIAALDGIIYGLGTP